MQPNTLFWARVRSKILPYGASKYEAELVIVDGALTSDPATQSRRPAETQGDRPDRIDPRNFSASGPRPAEGRLQVELAHLDYQQSRLVRSWTHLERQRGGFGFLLVGPGETQIEADRRMIRQRMARFAARNSNRCAKTRTLHRERRGQGAVADHRGWWDTPMPEKKSTLFNRLTGAEVMAEDLLFATLESDHADGDQSTGRRI